MMRKAGVAVAAAIWAAGAVSGCGGAGQNPAAAPPGLVVPERAGLFLEATRHYGELVVREVRDEEAEADRRPWSSYWYPMMDDILVKASPRNGGLATLEKVDRYARAILGRGTTAVREEIDKGYYNPAAEEWEGRCGSWAIASILEPEPLLPKEGVKVPGTDLVFFTRDVKALVIKSYERVDNQAFLRFGQPYEDAPGFEHEDIYPDQFHRVLQAELFGRRRAFVMDDAAGIEVWNTPIWKALVSIERDESDPRVMHVYTRLLGAQSLGVSPDHSGRSSDITYELTYDLVGELRADGGFLVKYGRWTGDSIRSHPDYVLTFPPEGTQVRHASENGQLTPGLVDEILARTGALKRR